MEKCVVLTFILNPNTNDETQFDLYAYEGYFIMKIRLLVEWNDRIAFFFLFSSSFPAVATSRILYEKAEIASYDVSTLTYLYIYGSIFYSFRNGQLHIADQIVCINDIYFDSYDSALANRAYQLLVDTKRLSFEFIIVKRTTTTTNIIDYSYAAVSTSNNDEHSCISILSTPFHVDMVVR
jgi:hypothetical protein